MKICDAHCHFVRSCYEIFGETRGEILTHSIDSIALCASFESEWETLKTLNAQNFGVCEIKKIFGAHPASIECETLESGKNFLKKLEKYLPFADAVGEAGLDARYFEKFSKEAQSEFFEEQVNLARRYALPLVVHCVGAWGELLKILEKNFSEFGKLKFLIHAASCSPELVKSFENLGACFSFGKRELSSKKGMECAKAAKNFMIESDINRIAFPAESRSFSSKNIADENLVDAANILAEIKGENVDEIFNKTSNLFKKFYSPSSNNEKNRKS